MTLHETVRKQVWFHGRTIGGCKLALDYLLSQGHCVFQFMDLFS